VPFLRPTGLLRFWKWPLLTYAEGVLALGSAVCDRPSVHVCPFLKPSLQANAAAAATQVAACYILVAATAAGLYLLLVVIILIIHSLLYLLYKLQTVVLLNIV